MTLTMKLNRSLTVYRSNRAIEMHAVKLYVQEISHKIAKYLFNGREKIKKCQTQPVAH